MAKSDPTTPPTEIKTTTSGDTKLDPVLMNTNEQNELELKIKILQDENRKQKDRAEAAEIALMEFEDKTRPAGDAPSPLGMYAKTRIHAKREIAIGQRITDEEAEGLTEGVHYDLIG